MSGKRSESKVNQGMPHPMIRPDNVSDNLIRLCETGSAYYKSTAGKNSPGPNTTAMLGGGQENNQASVK